MQLNIAQRVIVAVGTFGCAMTIYYWSSPRANDKHAALGLAGIAVATVGLTVISSTGRPGASRPRPDASDGDVP